MGFYYALKRHSAVAKGDHLDRVLSDQMVLKMISQRRLVQYCRAVAQRRPRVSKLGLTGPSDYHSNEVAVEAARRGPS
jgi:hypothetical protein